MCIVLITYFLQEMQTGPENFLEKHSGLEADTGSEVKQISEPVVFT